MFPKPIAQSSPFKQTAYKVFLPIALIIWLLPLIGIAMTSIRPAADLVGHSGHSRRNGGHGIEGGDWQRSNAAVDDDEPDCERLGSPLDERG